MTMLVAVLSIGAAAIHFAVMPHHFEEWWPAGLFFAAIGWFQALWPVAYAARRSSVLAALGIVVNVGIVVLWAVTRTVGLPFGPHPGIAEAAAPADLVATALEVLLLACLVAAPGERRDEMRPLASPVTRGGLALLVATGVAVATTLAVAVGS